MLCLSQSQSITNSIFFQRVNDTLIILTYAYNKPSRKNFTCKQNADVVGESEVLADNLMEPVRDFKCRTSNLEQLTCSFKQPRSSLHPLKYQLSYSINNKEVRSFFLEIRNQTHRNFIIPLKGTKHADKARRKRRIFRPHRCTKSCEVFSDNSPQLQLVCQEQKSRFPLGRAISNAIA